MNNFDCQGVAAANLDVNRGREHTLHRKLESAAHAAFVAIAVACMADSASAKSTMGAWKAGESGFGSDDYGAVATATVVPDGVVDGFREPYRRVAAGVSSSTFEPQSSRARFRSEYTETMEESFHGADKNGGR